MNIHMHVVMDVLPGKMGQFLTAVEEQYVPITERHGLHCIGFWQVAGFGRFPQCVALWGTDDWRVWTDFRNARYGGTDTALARWEETRLWRWCSGWVVRLLEPEARNLTYKEVEKRRGQAGLALNEFVQTVPGRRADYMRNVWEKLAPASAERGLALFGTYKNPYTNTEVLNLWTIKDWDAWAQAQTARLTDPRMAEWQREHLATRTDWQDLLLLPAPFSPLR